MKGFLTLRTTDGPVNCDTKFDSLCGFDFESQEITNLPRVSTVLCPAEEAVTINADKLGTFVVPADCDVFVSSCGKRMSAAYLEYGDTIWGLSAQDQLSSFTIQSVKESETEICRVYSPSPYLIQVGRRSVFCCSS